MHNNFYLLKRLSFELNEKLRGKTLVEAFSQNKDELILGFSISPEDDFFIKANLSSSFSCLSFIDNFARSKRNSINLFETLIGLEIKSVRYFLNERSFYLDFGSHKLVVKLFGRFSNVILFEGEQPIFLFNQQFEEDSTKSFSAYHKDIDQSQEAYVKNGFHETFPTLRGGIENELKVSGLFDLALDSQFQKVEELTESFLHKDIKVGLSQNKWKLTLMDTPLEEEYSFTEATEALTFFYNKYIADKSLVECKSKLIREKNGILKKLQKTVIQQESRLNKIENGTPEKEIADIIMANLHQIPERATEVDLFDFYRNETIKIFLKKDLNSQKNAERYYRRSKNAHLEKEKLEQNNKGVLAKIEILKKELAVIEEAKTYKELKAFIKEEKGNKKEESPFKAFEKEGFKIWVGRNSKNNDLLTLKYAHKDDLWLHAKDVSGSHVVIKVQSGKTTPQTVIEFAAELAAYYSKRKTDSLCPVTVTSKKFVRKVKGSPAGSVVVEKEDVILVEPNAHV